MMEFEKGKPHPSHSDDSGKCSLCGESDGYFLHKMYKGPPAARAAVHPTPAVPLETLEAKRAEIEEKALEASEVARSIIAVDHQFTAIGYIDPIRDLERLSQIAGAMLDDDKKKYPEAIRAKILAHEGNKALPEVTDDEIKLALFIKRTMDSPLTAEDIEAKATGTRKKKAVEPKEAKKSLAALLGVKPKEAQ